MNWSSHNEAFSSQLCSSGFQFHTQPSVSPLNGHHCPRHMQPRRILSTPPTCHTAACPFSICVCVSLSCAFVFHTQTHTHTMPLFLWSRLCLCSYSHHLATLFWCFSFRPLVCVYPLVCRGNSVSAWHLATVEMTSQTSQLIDTFLLFVSALFLFVIVFPPSSRWQRSTSAPPPAAVVQPCPGGTWAPSGSRGLRHGSFGSPGSYIRPLRTIGKGQPTQSVGSRRKPRDDHTASLCRWPQTHND